MTVDESSNAEAAYLWKMLVEDTPSANCQLKLRIVRFYTIRYPGEPSKAPQMD